MMSDALSDACWSINQWVNDPNYTDKQRERSREIVALADSLRRELDTPPTLTREG
jgi:hypothetical protein